MSTFARVRPKREYAKKVVRLLGYERVERLREHFTKQSYFDAAISISISETLEQALVEYRINRGLKLQARSNHLRRILERMCTEKLLHKPEDRSGNLFADFKDQIAVIADPQHISDSGVL